MDFSDSTLFKSTLTSCPLCCGISLTPLHVIERYTPPFKVDRCSSCGFIFMNPQFTEKTYQSYYDEGYFSGTSAYSYHDERDVKKYPPAVREKRIEKIHSYMPGGKFLDVGSAFGLFLASASRYYDPYGIEISSYAGACAREITGARIHIGTLENHPYPHGFFSVITMIEVIEHLGNPKETLAECFNLLAPGGLLVIQTANMGGLQAKLFGKHYAYYMPGHRSYFTKKNLSVALRGLGFKKVRSFHPVEFGLMAKLIKSRGLFRSPWDYRAWIRITLYHLAGKIRFGNFAATSSMVLYAFK